MSNDDSGPPTPGSPPPPPRATAGGVVTDMPEVATEPTVVVTLPGGGSVGIHDRPALRLRYPADLLGIIGCALAMVVVCLLVVYAGHTTQGITDDVLGATKWMERLLTGPVTALRTVLVLFAPVAVSAALLLRRQTTVLLTTLSAALAGLVLNTITLSLLAWLAPAELFDGLALGRPPVITMPPYAASILALLVAAAGPSRRRSLTASWALLWITVGVDIVTSKATLGGMGLSLLLGCLVGLAARYIVGVPSERAYGGELLAGLRSVGFDPVSLDRASLIQFDQGGQSRNHRVQVPQFFLDHRLYALKTTSGELFDVVVLDGDRQVVGVLRRWWRQLRSRGIDPRSVTSLRQSAERAALLAYSVKAAGLRTPGVLAMAEANDSMLLIRQPVPPSTVLAELADQDITDQLVATIWREVSLAHRAGIVHRALTDQAFRVHQPPSGDGQLWILGWEAGDVASSDLARHIDQAQLLAMTALKIGPQRAVALAAEQLGEDDLRAVGSLLQAPAMPARAREQLRSQPDLLSQLRQGLIERFPQAEVEPQQLARVSPKTVVSVLLTAVALFIVLTSFNLTEVGEALRASRWYWALAAFGLGLVGVLGAALILIAFSPVKIGLVKAWVSQLAASYVAVSVPAGIGTTGLNIRFLSKQGVKGSLATATAALVQVSQIAITALALIVLTLATGSTQTASLRVGPVVLIVAAVLIGAVGLLFAIPGSRTWLLAKIWPTLRQTWPRLVELVSNPGRLALGLGGNVVMLLGYAAAFQAALLAFGRDLPLVTSTIAYLVGNSAGSAAPTPGGMGAIEAAEMAALGAAGVNAGVAASVVLVFRLATFWVRIPLGWIAYRALERRGEL